MEFNYPVVIVTELTELDPVSNASEVKWLVSMLLAIGNGYNENQLILVVASASFTHNFCSSPCQASTDAGIDKLYTNSTTTNHSSEHHRKVVGWDSK